MSSLAQVLVAPVALGAVVLAGVYAVAVLDALFTRLAAGRAVLPGVVLVEPLRRSMLLLLQSRTRTERPDARLWALGSALLGAVGATALAVVPADAGLVAADIRGGIVLYGAAVAWVMIAVYLHGWSANSLFPLVGGYRFVAAALSYQIPLSLVLLSTALPAESLAVDAIVLSQAGLWNVLAQPLGLPVFLAAGLGLSFWGPFAFPDAEDLAGGTAAEASGGGLLLWRAGQAAVLVAVAAMAAAVFLGGWLGPWLPGPVWMALKTLAALAVLVGARQLFARVPLERFIWFGWVVLLPVALVDIFATGVLLLLMAP
jgi:NADH-quinone oxidoreductase subunit H